MADKKITQLPASTVPLAGTEVLPIVQGTTPTTKQVSVANLTAGRAVSAASLALTSAPLPIASGGTNQTAFTAPSGNVKGLVYFDGTSFANDATVTDAGYDTTTNTLTARNLTTTGNNILGDAQTDTLNVGNGDIVKDASGNTGFGTGAVAIAAKVQIQGSASSNGFLRFGRYNGYSGGLEFRSYSGSGGWDVKTGTGSNANLIFSRTEGTGDYVFNDANLVIGTSGKGIDFSATASGSGTMTSELLADYEEGTFTPTVSSGVTSPTYSANTGTYTKVGNIVYFHIYIGFSGGTKNTDGFTISGLPYTASGTGHGAYWMYNDCFSTATFLPTLYISTTSIGAYISGTGGPFIGTSFTGTLQNMHICGMYQV